MTTRLERPQGLGSVLAVLAILLSLPGHASAQQAGGQKGLEFSPGAVKTLAVPNLRPARL